MNENKAFVGQRVVVNNNIGEVHKNRLIPGMVGTIETVGYTGCVVFFDTPFMERFHNSWQVCGVNLERLDPAPEGAHGTIVNDA